LVARLIDQFPGKPLGETLPPFAFRPATAPVATAGRKG